MNLRWCESLTLFILVTVKGWREVLKLSPAPENPDARLDPSHLGIVNSVQPPQSARREMSLRSMSLPWFASSTAVPFMGTLCVPAPSLPVSEGGKAHDSKDKSERDVESQFQEQHARLAIAAATLLHRKEPPDQILSAALDELEGTPFLESFAPVSALRAVAKAAVAYNYRHIDPQIAFGPPTPTDDGDLAAPLLTGLPWPERAVHFLSKLLRYSRRDVALLLGISDVNVDQITRLAQKRLATGLTHSYVCNHFGRALLAW